RTFTAADDKSPGSDPYAVLSYAYWNKRFGLDASALGKTIQIHKTFFTIIGVAPPGFLGETIGDSPDLWLPLMMEPMAKPGRDWLHDDPSKAEKVMWLLVAGRLKPGVTASQAESSLNVLFQQIVHETAGSNLPPDRTRELAGQKIKIRPGNRGASSMRDEFGEPLWVLMTVVGVVLLIACVNVANLLLARAAARQREIAIRLALGAGRARLIRQLLTESLLLALMGGAIGILFAFWAGNLLVRMVAGGPNPAPLDVHPDASILTFTAGVSLLGAGLFLRTLQNLQNVDLGYPREKLLLVRVDPVTAGYQGARLAAVFRTLLERFGAIPGVRGVTLSENGLFSGTESGDRISVEGYKPQKRGDDSARFDQVGPLYFSTLGIPMLAGREIDQRDIETSARVCVINEAMARFFFENRNPIGKHITDEFPDTRTTFQIVGVSKDDRDHRLRGDIPRRFYIPFFQGLGGIPPAANFEIRTFADPNSMVRTVRREVELVDRGLAILNVSPLGELLDRTLTQERLIAQLCTLFGLLALVLACVGLYGVLSYSIARRTNEIGIRMALGALPSSVLGAVLRETLLVVAIGIAAGIPAAFALTRLVSSKLYGLKATDPLTIVAAGVVLIAAAMLAGYLPARRASRVDPLIALRYE
ncbi:MAG: ABC transporter permease, partial [Candidatus Solibacter usitatus]|nr:ABC transporter permease [Candidatus Solibacter usitatus]